MLTPENARWCVIVLASVLFVAAPIAWWLGRRDRIREGARLDQSGGGSCT